jgi:hypothetical protein
MVLNSLLFGRNFNSYSCGCGCECEVSPCCSSSLNIDKLLRAFFAEVCDANLELSQCQIHWTEGPGHVCVERG